MADSLGKLELVLEQALLEVQFFKQFSHAINHAALLHIFETKPEGSKVEVAARSANGAFYRGVLVNADSGGTAFVVLADDGEYVSGVKASSILSVQLKD